MLNIDTPPLQSPSPLYASSVVRTACLHAVVARGTLLALVGITPLLLGALLLPPSTLHGLGVVLFAFFLFCVVCGLLPYKRLAKKQLHPDVLHIEGPFLIYTINKRTQKHIPLSEVLSFHYRAYSQSQYGITLLLKDNKTPLFFPYFTQGTAHLLQSHLNDVMHP